MLYFRYCCLALSLPPSLLLPFSLPSLSPSISPSHPPFLLCMYSVHRVWCVLHCMYMYKSLSLPQHYYMHFSLNCPSSSNCAFVLLQHLSQQVLVLLVHFHMTELLLLSDGWQNTILHRQRLIPTAAGVHGVLTGFNCYHCPKTMADVQNWTLKLQK